jgi:transketolase
MPNVTVWRPCDAVETAWAWKAALDHTQGPTALLLSRQTLPAQARSAHALSAIGKGGYVLQSAPSGGDCVIIATGSEVALAMEAAAVLGEQGWKIQVVSMPCMETFLAQDRAYRDQVIPPTQPARVVIEAGIAMGWESLLGAHGLMLGVEHYGASGPANAVYEAMGLSLPMIVKRIQQWAGSIPKKEEIKDGN